MLVDQLAFITTQLMKYQGDELRTRINRLRNDTHHAAQLHLLFATLLHDNGFAMEALQSASDHILARVIASVDDITLLLTEPMLKCSSWVIARAEELNCVEKVRLFRVCVR